MSTDATTNAPSGKRKDGGESTASFFKRKMKKQRLTRVAVFEVSASFERVLLGQVLLTETETIGELRTKLLDDYHIKYANKVFKWTSKVFVELGDSKNSKRAASVLSDGQSLVLTRADCSMDVLEQLFRTSEGVLEALKLSVNVLGAEQLGGADGLSTTSPSLASGGSVGGGENGDTKTVTATMDATSTSASTGSGGATGSPAAAAAAASYSIECELRGKTAHTDVLKKSGSPVWNQVVPLGFYTGNDMLEIRLLRHGGEKRLAAVTAVARRGHVCARARISLRECVEPGSYERRVPLLSDDESKTRQGKGGRRANRSSQSLTPNGSMRDDSGGTGIGTASSAPDDGSTLAATRRRPSPDSTVDGDRRRGAVEPIAEHTDASGTAAVVSAVTRGGSNAQNIFGYVRVVLDVQPAPLGKQLASAASALTRNVLRWPPPQGVEVGRSDVGPLDAHKPDNPNLILNSTGLRVIPERLFRLTKLEVLALNANALEVIPSRIVDLKLLRVLRLWSNKLKTLPDELALLPNLESLDVGKNGLTAVPDVVTRLTTLTELYLHYNRVTHVPVELRRLTRLRVLNVGINPITELSAKLRSLHNLDYLDASHCELRTVPSFVSKITSLTTLKLVGNDIECVPEWVGTLTDLRQLDMSNNPLHTVPRSLRHCRLIRSLAFRNNKLRSLSIDLLGNEADGDGDEEEGVESELRELYVTNNRLRSVDGLCSLTTLEKLYLWKNHISRLPDAIGALQQVVILDLSQNRLRELPSSIGELQSLRVLQLARNELTALPDEFGRLTDLVELSLYMNRLQSLPDTLGDMIGLQTLRMGFNEVRDLPSSMSRLTRLGCLDVGSNMLSAIPPWLGELSSLQQLNVFGMRLEASPQLPTALGRLEALNTMYLSYCAVREDFAPELASLRLQTLALDGNRLVIVPPTLLSFSSLKILHISNNELTALPDDFDRLAHLQYLHLEGNQLTELPAAVYRLGELHELNVAHNRLISLSTDVAKWTQLIDLDVSHNYLRSVPTELKALKRLQMLKFSFNSIMLHSWSDDLWVECTSVRPRLNKKEEKLLAVSSEPDESVIGWAEMQGRRPNQEDALVIVPSFRRSPNEHFYAMFDGHAGPYSAQHCASVMPSIFAEILRHREGRRASSLDGVDAVGGEVVDTGASLAADLASLQFPSLGSTSGGSGTGSSVSGGGGGGGGSGVATSANVATGGGSLGSGIGKWGKRRNTGSAASPATVSGSPPSPRAAASKSAGASLKRSEPASRTSSSGASSARAHDPEFIADMSEVFDMSFQRASAEIGAMHVGDGTTAICAYVRGQTLVLANAGDSRAVLYDVSGATLCATDDHKPMSRRETRRIREAGGFITETGRVCGTLGLSRAIGDEEFQPMITHRPDVSVYALDSRPCLLLIACDGLFDMVSNEQAALIIDEPQSPVRQAMRLRDYAHALGSTDNISVIVVHLNGYRAAKEEFVAQGGVSVARRAASDSVVSDDDDEEGSGTTPRSASDSSTTVASRALKGSLSLPSVLEEESHSDDGKEEEEAAAVAAATDTTAVHATRSAGSGVRSGSGELGENVKRRKKKRSGDLLKRGVSQGSTLQPSALSVLSGDALASTKKKSSKRRKTTRSSSSTGEANSK